MTEIIIFIFIKGQYLLALKIYSYLIGSLNTPVTRTHVYVHLAQKCSRCWNGSYF